MNKYNMFSNSKNNRLNNRDFNIDQNNRDYDFFHNRAALIKGHHGCLCECRHTLNIQVITQP